ncbi:MAG: sigma-70 family RNA polymerase sigma factor [Gammaproteobacteria bacterium]
MVATERLLASVGEDGRQLIGRVAEGDRIALEGLYDRYAQLVFALALRILRNQTDAEEVVQDVFWQVWRNATRYDPARGTPDAWLFTLARTRALDALRLSRRSEGLALEEASEVSEDLAAEGAQATEIRQIVTNALNGLSKVQRTAIELAYYGGLTQTEIAQHTGAPLGTVKTWIRKGLAQLRDTFVAEKLDS